MKTGKMAFIILSILLVFVMAIGCGGTPNSGNQQEGIEVHGHWKIEVLNSDGSSAGVHEFENALYTALDADLRLVDFLARNYSVGGWVISAGNNAGGEINPFFDPDDPETTKYCYIMEPAGQTLKPNQFDNLSLSVGTSNQLVLTGTAIAQRDGSINQVYTLVARQPNTEPPSIYYNGSSYGANYFTVKTLESAIPVSEGQYILFTVELSFS